VGADSFKNISYGGSINAITSSAITEKTTNAAQKIPHRSHDDDAFSSVFSAAFIRPFRRYQAGTNTFGTFFLALAIWALLLGPLLWFIAR
jgi:hypothetical protein